MIMNKNKTVALAIMALLSGYSFADTHEYYASIIPTNDGTGVYYTMGGGNVVPDSPSTVDRIPLYARGNMGLHYLCGKYNQSASIVNSINGIKSSFQNTFNHVVQNAQGALQEMPAYLIARNRPALYQMLQNGFFSGQYDFGLKTKDCHQLDDEINAGKNPYQDLFKVSMKNDWVSSMDGSSQVPLNQMTYTAAQASDIGQAQQQVVENDGKNGIPWTHGVMRNQGKYAGGEGQPEIKLNYDIIMAGANATVGRDTYDNDNSLPRDSALARYWSKPSDIAKWGQSVLGERVVTTSQGGNKHSVPGKGLLPNVQDTYKNVFQQMSDLVSGRDDITTDNLKKVSTASVIINKEVITTLSHERGIMRSIEVSALSQGIASAKVVDKAQMLIQILQASQEVPAIATNSVAQDQIQKDISTLQSQINMVISFKENNEKLITSTIKTIVQSREQYKNSAVGNRPTGSMTMPTSGVVPLNP